MDTFSVVVVEPGVKGLGVLGAAGEYLPVGPLGLERAVEAFDLAVGPRAVRFDEALLRAEGRHGILESAGFSVGEGVVGEDAFNYGDAAAGEEGGRAEENTGGGDALFVGSGPAPVDWTPHKRECSHGKHTPAELLRLRKENADLKLDRAFLKKASIFFAQEASDTNAKRSN